MSIRGKALQHRLATAKRQRPKLSAACLLDGMAAGIYTCGHAHRYSTSSFFS
jgi:hypothetical protein